MIDLAEAVSIFRKHCAEREWPTGNAEKQCIDRKSYFFFADPEPVIGTLGVIIDKKDGALMRLGSGYNREMAFGAYERGDFFRRGMVSNVKVQMAEQKSPPLLAGPGFPIAFGLG